jgi:hypothetical protein
MKLCNGVEVYGRNDSRLPKACQLSSIEKQKKLLSWNQIGALASLCVELFGLNPSESLCCPTLKRETSNLLTLPQSIGREGRNHCSKKT